MLLYQHIDISMCWHVLLYPGSHSGPRGVPRGGARLMVYHLRSTTYVDRLRGTDMWATAPARAM